MSRRDLSKQTALLRDTPPDAPLRLDVAAALAFPDGSIGASALRREAARGRLEIWQVAGKTMTTLSAVARMMDRCRVDHPLLNDDHQSGKRSRPGSSSTSESISPRDALLAKLRTRK